MAIKGKPRREPAATGNRLLAALPEPESARLAPALEAVSLELKQPLIQAGQPIHHLFFPTTAMASVLVVMEDGAEVEAGLIGPEGLVGLSAALGLDFAIYRVICQVPGEAWRMPARAFQQALQRSGPLAALIQRYTAVQLRQTAQLVACNALHTVTERLCRWLLMSHDRVGCDEFPMTQEFMSELLGLQRPSVTLIAGMLQQAGLISYKRGVIRVKNRRGLEEASCECYAVMNELYRRIIPELLIK
jgi:CRP-like cAMP-binding protein